MLHRRPGRAVLAALVATFAWGACGTGTNDPAPSDSTGASDQPRSPTPSVDPQDSSSRDPLADQVEKFATEVPSAPDVTLSDPTYGSDISWPQCTAGVGPIPERVGLGMPMPKPEWEFVIVGLTNGPAMTQNPCLSDQLTWAKERKLLVSAYAVATYPSDADLAEHGDDGPYDADTTPGRLANWGHAQAEFNLATLEEMGLDVPAVWIDVEPVPTPPLVAWSSDKAANAAVVKGIERAYREADLTVGVYSTPGLWDTVVGNLSFGVPEWRAAGETSESEAVSRCGGESIQGGDALIGQWVEERRDRNVTCPGRAKDLSGWFVRL